MSKMVQIEEALRALSADQVRAMSDDDLALHARATTIMLETISAEFARRNAIQSGEPATTFPERPIGHA